MRARKLASALLIMILMALAVGCQPQGPKEEQGILKIREGVFLPAADRQQIIPFQGTDLYTEEEVAFDVDAQGRVRILSFFSLG